jgi:iron complex outermembrane receptor protein
MVNYLGRLFLLTLFLCPAISWAQATAPDATPAPEKLERVEVTGSHIKRIDVEGVAPVETVTKKDIEKKGYDNLGDVVKDLGVNSFGSTNTVNANSGAPGNADISLRGLGSDNTLVLLNGQRLPQDALTGTVDINMIPMAAVERIEILKDGASAIYGSDALGGVVNIITVKDFQGTQVSGTQSFSTNEGGGKQTNLSLVNGINGEKFNAVTSINYRYNQAVQSNDRPWLAGANSSLGSPGTYYGTATGSNKYASPNCPLSSVVSTGVGGGSYCQFHYPDYSEEAPLVSQVGVMTELHYELSSDVRLFARLSYTNRYSQTIAAPAPGTFTIPSAQTGAITGSGDTPNYTAADGDLNIDARTLAAGLRINDYKTDSYGALVGATFQLPKDWQADLTANLNYIRNESDGVSGYSRICSNGIDANTGLCLGTGTTGISDLVVSGAYNPLAPNGAQGDVSSAHYVPIEISDSLLTVLEFKASGDVLELPAGPLGLAVGTSVAFSQYHDNSDSETVSGNVLGGGGGDGAGHRTQEAVYGEFSVPVVTKKLELQLASRYDHFSDFGSTFNPKFGFLYHANRDLLFRGSVGTGFRAPLLTELYAGASEGAPTFTDFAGCAAHPGNPVYCQAKQYTVIGSSNPDLKQETSTSYNLGTIYEPTRDLNFGFDFFYTKINNVPGIDYDDMERAEAAGQNLAAGVDGVQVVRNPDGSINHVNAPLLNLSEIEESGIDMSAGYTLNKWKIGTEQNQLFFYKTSGFPGVPIKDKLGWSGMPRWRNTTTLGYNFNDRNNLTGYVRTIPGQLKEDQSGSIRGLTTLDLAYTIRTPSWGEFTITVINVLNTPPPVDDSSPTSPVNYSLYDLNGRQVVVGYKKMI